MKCIQENNPQDLSSTPLCKSVFENEEGFIKYVGIIPTFNNRGIFEMANNGKFDLIL